MLFQEKQKSNGISIENIRAFVKYWNTTYPIDYWWRHKHEVPFGSQVHLDQNILDMRIEFEEDRLLKEEQDIILKKEKYRPGRGDWLDAQSKAVEITEEQTDQLFEDLDIGALQKLDMAKKKVDEVTDKIKKR